MELTSWAINILFSLKPGSCSRERKSHQQTKDPKYRAFYRPQIAAIAVRLVLTAGKTRRRPVSSMLSMPRNNSSAKRAGEIGGSMPTFLTSGPHQTLPTNVGSLVRQRPLARTSMTQRGRKQSVCTGSLCLTNCTRSPHGAGGAGGSMGAAPSPPARTIMRAAR
jgi:hypothetical protein